MIKAPQQPFSEQLMRVFDAQYSISERLNFSNYLQKPIHLSQFTISNQPDEYINSNLFGAGACKLNGNDAYVASVCEFLERNSLRYSHDDQFKNIFRFDQIPVKQCIPMDEIREIQGIHPIQFNFSQMPLHPLNKNTQFTWIKAHRLLSEEEIFVPAKMCVLLTNTSFETTTNGCALAKTKEEAIEKAIYELLERHLVMQFWWKKVEPVYFNLSKILDDFRLEELKCAFGPWLKYIHLATIPHPFGIPIFLLFFGSENIKGHPAFVMSAACHWDPITCLEKALTELGGMLNTKVLTIQKILNTNILRSANFDKDIASFTEHHDLYTLDIGKKFLHFQLPDNSAADYEDFPVFQNFSNEDVNQRLNYLKTKFKELNYNPFYVDQTAPFVSEFNLHVFRVIDAKLIDLNSRHVTRRWGKSQLFDAHIQNVFHLNQYPHPFP